MIILKHAQKGFTAILAVVVLVLFALIGVYMSTQMTTASIETSTSYLGIQAGLDARSGVDWGIYQALHGSSCAASTSFAIGDFSVTVECTSASITEGPDSYTVYNLRATASRGNPGDVLYVSREVVTSVTDG